MLQALMQLSMSDEEGENRGNTRTMACMNGVKNDNAIRGCCPGRLFIESSYERLAGMHTRMSRRQFLATGGKVVLGAGLAGPLLAGCGGGGQGGGPVTYWSNLDVGQDYFKQNIEKPFEKSNQ